MASYWAPCGREQPSVWGWDDRALLWYLFFRRYNRRQGEQAVAWIQSALAGTGQVVAVRWLGPSIFQVAASAGHWPVPSSGADGAPDATPHAAALAAAVVASRAGYRSPGKPTSTTRPASIFRSVATDGRAAAEGVWPDRNALDIRAGNAAHPDLAPELAAGSHRHDECPAQLPRLRGAEPRLPPHFARIFPPSSRCSASRQRAAQVRTSSKRSGNWRQKRRLHERSFKFEFLVSR